MPLSQVVEGTVVARYENSYDTFQASDGSTVQAGTKRLWFVVAEFEEAPREITFRGDAVRRRSARCSRGTRFGSPAPCRATSTGPSTTPSASRCWLPLRPNSAGCRRQGA